MKNNEKVNVLMCIYKENIEIVKTAVLSIMQQTYSNIELIVVIDNPERTDVINLLETLKKEKPIRYCVNSQNLGLPSSLNVGLKMCDAPYIARMDADDVSVPNRLEKQMIFLRQSHSDIVGGYIDLIDEEDNFVRKRKDFPLKDKYIREMLYYRDCIPHPTWFVKKELYDKLQGYRNIPFLEDYDFLVRAALVGTRFGVLPQVCLKYRISSNGITQKNLAMQKFLSRYIQQQYRSEDIMDSGDVQEYIKKNQKQFDYIIKFYELAKKSRKTPVIWLQLIFSRQMFAEVRERLGTKIILWKDKHGYC